MTALALAASCAVGRNRLEETPPSPEAILESPDLPKLRARSGSTDIPVVRGSLCWSKGGAGVCADAIAPPELAKTVAPAELPPGAAIMLEHAPPPLADSLLVNRWIDGRPVRVVLQAGSGPGNRGLTPSFVVPDEPGTYVYDAFARWPQGDVSWAFHVMVKK